MLYYLNEKTSIRLTLRIVLVRFSIILKIIASIH